MCNVCCLDFNQNNKDFEALEIPYGDWDWDNLFKYWKNGARVKYKIDGWREARRVERLPDVDAFLIPKGYKRDKIPEKIIAIWVEVLK